MEGLLIEAARIQELATKRFATAQQEYSGEGKPAWVQPDRARAYMINAVGLHSLNTILLGRELWIAAIEVAAKVDTLNSAIEVDGALGRLKGTELIRRLEAVAEFAQRLQQTLSRDPMIRDD